MALVLMTMAACDAQVDADYGGEPLLVLEGNIVAVGEIAVRGMVLRWQTTDPRGPGEHQSALSLHTSFPNRFQAGVLGEPPEGGRVAFTGEPGFAEGYLFARDGRRRTLGADYGRALVWLSAAAPEGGATAAYLGAALPAGFHVMTRVEAPVAPPEQGPLVEQCVTRARAEGWDAARAETTCRLGRAYRLTPAPRGLAEPWTVTALPGGT